MLQIMSAMSPMWRESRMLDIPGTTAWDCFCGVGRGFRGILRRGFRGILCRKSRSMAARDMADRLASARRSGTVVVRPCVRIFTVLAMLADCR